MMRMPLPIDPCIARWVLGARKPLHHVKMQPHCDGPVSYGCNASMFATETTPFIANLLRTAAYPCAWPNELCAGPFLKPKFQLSLKDRRTGSWQITYPVLEVVQFKVKVRAVYPSIFLVVRGFNDQVGLWGNQRGIPETPLISGLDA